MPLSHEAKAIGDRPYFPVPETFLPDSEGGIANNMWFPATNKGITIRQQAVMTFMAARYSNAMVDAKNDKYVERANEMADAYLESLAECEKDGAKLEASHE